MNAEVPRADVHVLHAAHRVESLKLARIRAVRRVAAAEQLLVLVVDIGRSRLSIQKILQQSEIPL